MSIELFNPYVDFVFKGIFKNSPNSLAALICDLQGWPKDRIKSIKYLDKELTKDHLEGKAGAVDLLVEIEDRKKIQIEVQVVAQDFYPQRTLFYTSRLYAQQLYRGESYGELQPLICIHLLLFNLFNDDRPLRSFKFNDTETGELLIDHLEIKFLEVKKNFPHNDKIHENLIHWMNFIKNPNEERAMLEDKYPFKEAYEELERLSKDPANKWAYESAYKAIKDEESRIKDASLVAEAKGLAKGLAEGKAEGLAEGLTEGVLKGKAEGLTEGKAEGLAEGVLKGKAEGLTEGKAEGLAEGVLKGKAETEMTMITKMHANGLSIEQISQFTAIHPNDILKILNS